MSCFRWFLFAIASIASSHIRAQEYVPEALNSKLTVELLRDKGNGTNGCVLMGSFGLMELGVEAPIAIRLLLTVSRDEAYAVIRVTALELRDGAVKRSTDIQVRRFSVSTSDLELVTRRPKKVRELGKSAFAFQVDPLEAIGILQAHEKGRQVQLSFDGGDKGFPDTFTYMPTLGPISDTYLEACIGALTSMPPKAS